VAHGLQSLYGGLAQVVVVFDEDDVQTGIHSSKIT
jgi:hypothetical protein